MDKINLNNEIINCRPLIRRARVCIIRKKIKKIKILKACKKEDLKDKKLKKAERITEEIMILKKIKEDDVTKFALLQEDLHKTLKNSPSNDHEHVYATLALFPDVKTKIDAIRQQIPDWETTLPKLLQELGTRTMLKKYRRINLGLSLKPKKKNRDQKSQQKRDISSSVNLSNALESEEDKSSNSDNSDPDTETRQAKVVKKNTKSNAKETPDVPKKKEAMKPVEKEEIKVDDPFFVSKKVIVPKLLLTEMKENPDKEIKFSKDEPERWRDKKPEPRMKQFTNTWNTSGGTRRNEGTKRNNFQEAVLEKPKEEKLHPSWEAKKVKLIQPFQGKKIKFDLD